MRLWNPTSGQETAIFPGPPLGGVSAVAWRPDGKLLAAADHNGALRLCDPTTGKEKGVLKGHTSLAMGVAWSPDGKLLAGASWDETVKLWDVSRFK